jgi:hypothetical protein
VACPTYHPITSRSPGWRSAAGPAAELRLGHHRDNVTLVQVLLRQAGQVIHRSKTRLGSHAAQGSCRKRNSQRPTRLTEPHEEQDTVKIPRAGRGSEPEPPEWAGSPSWAGVGAEKRACRPAGRA